MEEIRTAADALDSASPIDSSASVPSQQQRRHIDVRVLTWNVLADCYSSDSREVWEQIRSKRVAAVLRQFADYDLLLLEEVDHYEDFYRPLLESLGFCCCYVQRPTKTDGCLICYRASRSTALRVEEVQFNDLVRMRDVSENTRNALCRHNVGLIVQLEEIEAKEDSNTSGQVANGGGKVTKLQFTAGVAHMFWNPAYPEIKSAQAEYFLSRLCIFARHFAAPTGLGAEVRNWPVIVGGDYNATPLSEPYKIMNSPFYFPTEVPSLHSSIEHKVITSTTIISKRFSDRCYYGGANTKFLCDADMSRLCRWLRLLGVDAAMHVPKKRHASSPEEIAAQRSAKKANGNGTSKVAEGAKIDDSVTSLKAEKNVRTSSGRKSDEYSEIFERATREKRVVLTTSKNMRLRAACPESMLVDSQNLEKSLAEIVKNYKIPLRRENFLTVCGKCGGAVVEITPEEYVAASRQYLARHEQLGTKPQILRSSYRKNKSLGCPKSDNACGGEGELWIPRDRPIFMCVDCTQPYWWNESETSTPARAMMLADCLFNIAAKGLAEEPSPTSSSLLDNAEQPTDAEVVSENLTEEIHTIEAKKVGASISDLESGRVTTVDRETLVQMFATRDKHLVTYSKYHEESTTTTISEPTTVSDNAQSEASTDEIAEREAAVASVGGNRRLLKVHSKAEDLSLQSAHLIKHGSEPKYTNWTETFYGTLDYIFVSELCDVIDADTAPKQSDAPRSSSSNAKSSAPLPSAVLKKSADVDIAAITGHLASTGLSDGSDDSQYKCASVASVPESIASTVVAGPFPSDKMPSDHIVVRATLRLTPPI